MEPFKRDQCHKIAKIKLPSKHFCSIHARLLAHYSPFRGMLNEQLKTPKYSRSSVDTYTLDGTHLGYGPMGQFVKWAYLRRSCPPFDIRSSEFADEPVTVWVNNWLVGYQLEAAKFCNDIMRLLYSGVARGQEVRIRLQQRWATIRECEHDTRLQDFLVGLVCMYVKLVGRDARLCYEKTLHSSLSNAINKRLSRIALEMSNALSGKDTGDGGAHTLEAFLDFRIEKYLVPEEMVVKKTIMKEEEEEEDEMMDDGRTAANENTAGHKEESPEASDDTALPDV